MPRANETKVTNDIRKRFRGLGFYFRKLHSGRYVDNQGLLDSITCLWGLGFWLEVKKDKKAKVRRIQERNVFWLHTRSCFAAIVSSPDEAVRLVVEYVEEFLQEARQHFYFASEESAACKGECRFCSMERFVKHVRELEK